jgi:hypothetical protein
MSYILFSELEESHITLPKLWNGSTSISELIPNIPERNVRFSEPIQHTVRFLKDSPPIACNEFNPKFQIPCDTIGSSSSCFQSNQQIMLMR